MCSRSPLPARCSRRSAPTAAREATKECHGVLELHFGDLRTNVRATRLTLERPRAERFSEDLVDEFERGGRAAARAARLCADGEDRDHLAAFALLVRSVRNKRKASL
jgi:hypothetical protein